ncbi:MAG: hypothetical protein QNJ46_31120 [Leptolyngbyaceae cyanobacterium MO_188.B28]|nr:hypothetical protein [Leptolyngbyaceae cyanobacterium MO_188.B28]
MSAKLNIPHFIAQRRSPRRPNGDDDSPPYELGILMEVILPSGLQPSNLLHD